MTDATRIIRCSALNGLFACTPSVSDDTGMVRINTAEVPVELGKPVRWPVGNHRVQCLA